PGEICVRSVHAFEGYWNLPEVTAEATQYGWLHTGDVARADPQGYLYIVDRRKDMIVTGGFNVYPREVEDALSAHPAVSQAAVFGVPDAKWGEAVAAAVVLRAGAQVEAEALMQHVRARKGPVQTPKRIDFMDALPSTSVGKVDKKQLRAAFWAGRDRMVG
ncbi:MAG: AMP-binding protein, partial [Phenylobacterium sp.]